MISRRGFFGLVSAAVVAPFVPAPAPLAFRKDAFALVGSVPRRFVTYEWLADTQTPIHQFSDAVYDVQLAGYHVGDRITVRLPKRYQTAMR